MILGFVLTLFFFFAILDPYLCLETIKLFGIYAQILFGTHNSRQERKQKWENVELRYGFSETLLALHFCGGRLSLCFVFKVIKTNSSLSF